jgi:apolipoprotein N-acyltransferase
MIRFTLMSRMKRFFSNFKHKSAQHIKENKSPILAGILMGTSYIPFPPWALLFCFAPLWVTILRDTQNYKQAFMAGWWTQFCLSLIGFHWIAYVSKEFGYMPWPLALLTLLVFAASVHIYYALASTLTFYFRKKFHLKPLSAVFIVPSLMVLFEQFWPSLFPWNLGYPLLSFAPTFFIAQMGDTIGFLGLSFLVHLVNVLVAFAWLSKDRLFAVKALSPILVLFVIFHFWGKSKHADSQITDQNLKVLITQANIGNFEKLQAEKGRGFQQQILDQYFSLTKSALQNNPDVDLIIWPESAYPDFLNQHEKHRFYTQRFFQFISEIQKPILTGAYSSDPPEKIPRHDYNGLFLFDGSGAPLSEPYHKTKLLAFGEFTPFSDIFPFLAKISPAGSGFGRGPGPTVMNFKDLKLGLQICYESLYPGFSEMLSKKGADLLINLTNDSWFGPTFEPHQHLWMTLARAVETRRPLIRSTNTGISTVALASGEVLQKSPLYQTWTGEYLVSFKQNAAQTFHTQYRRYFALVYVLIFLFGFIFVNRRRA